MEQCACSLWVNIVTAGSTLLAATIGTWLAYFLPKKWKLEQDRRVALAIMRAFEHEIGIGVGILQQIRDGSRAAELPDTAWKTYENRLSIPIIDVCVQCEKGIEKHAHKSPTGFHASEFLQHLKNYYECICARAKVFPAEKPAVRDALCDAANNVMYMIDSIVKELERTSS